MCFCVYAPDDDSLTSVNAVCCVLERSDLCPGFCGLYKDRSPALTFLCLRLSTARPQEVEMGSFKQAVYES